MLKLMEIKELSQDEIVDQLKKSRIELVDLRMKFASRQLENPSLIKKKRKEIARLLTIETQKLSGKNGKELKTEDESAPNVKAVKKEKKSQEKKTLVKKKDLAKNKEGER